MESNKGGKYQRWKVPEAESTRGGTYQRWKVPELESTRGGKYNMWKVPEVESTRGEKYQRWKVPEVVSTRGGKYHRWKVPEVKSTRGGQSQRWEVPEVKSTIGGIYQRWKVPEVESTRDGRYQRWKVPEVESTIGGKAELRWRTPLNNILSQITTVYGPSSSVMALVRSADDTVWEERHWTVCEWSIHTAAEQTYSDLSTSKTAPISTSLVRYSRRLVLLVKATLDNSRAVAKASDSRFRETGFDSFAAVSNTEQVASLYIAPVYSAV